METEPTNESGTIHLAFRVSIDAEDLVLELGAVEAQRRVRAAMALLCEDLGDRLLQDLTEVDGVPVAVLGRPVAVRLKQR